MAPENRIRVMLVDDHQVVRQGFTLFLKAFADLELVGEAANGQQAVDLCDELKPDVILMDMVMPILDGASATRIIRERQPHVQVIGLTSFSDNRELVTKALEAGAIGYLFKDISIDDLAKAIRTAYQGDPILAPEATRMLIQARTQPTAKDYNLTEREREVLASVVAGMNNREIAEQLILSRSTIKFHVSSILGKLGASSRTEAVAIALQAKLVDEKPT